MSDDAASETDDGVFSRGQERVIVKVAQACASLSLVGSIVIVVARLRFKQLRTYSFQLVAWLAVCDIFVNLSYFLGSPSEGSFLCYTQAILQQFFQVALIQWTLLISQSLLVVASKTSVFNGKRRMPWNHFWAWGVSVALIIGPLGTTSFGQAECSFCWIKSNDTFASWNAGSLWRGVFLAIVFLSMVVIIWTYVTVINRLGRAQQSIALLSSHASGGKKHYTTPHSMHKTQGNLANERDERQLGNVLSVPTSAKPGTPLRPSLAYRAPSSRQVSQYRQGALQSNRGQDVQTGVDGENASKSQLTPRRGSFLKRLISRGSIDDRDLGVDDKEKPAPKPIARQASGSEAPPPKPRRGSFLNRLISHESIDDRDSGQGEWEKRISEPLPRRVSVSGGPLPRRNSLLKRMISGSVLDEHGEANNHFEGNEDASRSSFFSLSMDNSSRRSSLFSLSAEATSRRPSLFSFYRTSSQVRSKEWLWSTSRDAGFLEEEVSGGNGKEDEKGLVMWVNLSASHSSSGPMEQMPPPNPLPTLMEANICRAASSTSAPIADRSNDVSTPSLMHQGLRQDEVGSDGSRTGSARDVSTTTPHEGEETKVSDWSNGDDSTSKKPRTVAFAATTSPAEHDANRSGAESVAPTRSMKPRFIDGAGRARKFIHRMSSLDLDHVSSGGNRYTSPEEGRFVAVVQLSNEGRGKAESGVMEKFIARVKWYPVIYVLCWLFTLINGVHTLASGTENSSFVLVLLAVGTSRLQGLLNFIWYGLNDSLKQAWLQDFLYRRAVASCCRALLCFCSGPCCPKLDDGENGAVGDEYRNDHADPDTRAPVTAAKTSNDLEDRLEESGGTRTMIALSSPPAHSPTASGLLVPPSTPMTEFFTQVSTPRRPSRPGRKSCSEKLKESKTHDETRTTQLPRRSYAPHRRTKNKGSSRKVSAGRRKTKPLSEREGAAGTPIPSNAAVHARHGGDSKSTVAGTGKRGRLPLNPALPISISMPVTNPSSASTSGKASPTRGSPLASTSVGARRGNSSTQLKGSHSSRRWETDQKGSLSIK